MPDILPVHNLYASALADCASSTRHDGWTRECKITFCEVLAITGRIVEALDAVDKSGNTAYAQRRRDPAFAAAWEAALVEARHRLADTLLARAMDGTHIVTHNQYGECTGSKTAYDNRLGLALLRRLARLAETGRTTTRPRVVAAAATAAAPDSEGTAAPTSATQPEPLSAPPSFAAALAALAAAPDPADAPQGHETHETHKFASLRVDEVVGTPPAERAPPHEGEHPRALEVSRAA